MQPNPLTRATGIARLLLVFSPLDANELTREELEPYIGGLDRKLIEPMARFLDSANAPFAAMGSRQEVVNHSFMVGLGIESDGTFLWDTCAAQYVRHYAIALPTDLIAHAESKGYEADWLSDEDLLAVRDDMWSNLEQKAQRKRELWVNGPPPVDSLLA